MGYSSSDIDVVVECATRLATVINESVKIAKESGNPGTVLSRLNFAKQKLGELKALAEDYDFIAITSLEGVEAEINSLEAKFAKDGFAELLVGARFLCALDESTCLICLELDGCMDAPPPPIHEGCRCTTVPVTKSFRELGIDLPEFSEGSRASAIGQVAKDGGLYKQYLIQRARGIASGIQGAALGEHLKDWLRNAGGEDSDLDLIATIHSEILRSFPSQSLDEVLSVLARVTGGRCGHLFEACAKAGAYSALTESVQRMAQNISDGPYAARHCGSLYRDAAKAAQPYSPETAADYMVQAAAHDPLNVAVLMELSGVLRRIGKINEARHAVEKALLLNPTHKGAIRELERLGRIK